jgi:DnaK suppressor protein
MTGIDKDMIAILRARLEEQRRQIIDSERDESGQSATELDQSRVGRLSRVDALQRQAVADAARQWRRLEHGRIRAALKRMDDDEYGFCGDCGREIDVRRLEVDPAAERCIECARAAEKR